MSDQKTVPCRMCGLPKDPRIGMYEDEHDGMHVCLNLALEEIARLTRELGEAYTRGWNEAMGGTGVTTVSVRYPPPTSDDPTARAIRTLKPEGDL